MEKINSFEFFRPNRFVWQEKPKGAPVEEQKVSPKEELRRLEAEVEIPDAVMPQIRNLQAVFNKEALETGYTVEDSENGTFGVCDRFGIRVASISPRFTPDYPNLRSITPPDGSFVVEIYWEEYDKRERRFTSADQAFYYLNLRIKEREKDGKGVKAEGELLKRFDQLVGKVFSEGLELKKEEGCRYGLYSKGHKVGWIEIYMDGKGFGIGADGLHVEDHGRKHIPTKEKDFDDIVKSVEDMIDWYGAELKKL